jgi:hypothetical protein
MKRVNLDKVAAMDAIASLNAMQESLDRLQEQMNIKRKLMFWLSVYGSFRKFFLLFVSGNEMLLRCEELGLEYQTNEKMVAMLQRRTDQILSMLESTQQIALTQHESMALRLINLAENGNQDANVLLKAYRLEHFEKLPITDQVSLYFSMKTVIENARNY